MKKVAIQGGLGAYHDIAARNYFGEEIEIVPCLTFKEIFLKAQKDEHLIGIMAIENTIAGGLLLNHDLLKLNDMKIAGEHKLRISHTLSALPGQRLQDIREIVSHPMALMQCSDFIESLPQVKVVEHEDTALAAREIMEGNTPGIAAICSKLAAEVYHLEVIREGIETNKRNFTRFLVLAHEEMVGEIRKSSDIDKASLVFVLPHSEGSLSRVLSVLSFYDINLTRIQSLPIIGREWEYQFYIDLTFSNFERYRQSIKAILPLVGNLKVLGEYVEDKHIVAD
ncbi:MAG: prephenate dehydratase [Petrimonas sp.]|jgi:prephenate dehydratase|uniref:prephenate dehydratase n=1 Tax=bioreactor metagenome TaxID=1076179 RepID=A0A645B9A1_9ZZZZ|nr:prephenate dehydratase [Petrimonas sp.]NLU28870.1 prephenate dehydratase [Bacteroidales bacterium]HAC73796.1 prephenate dehydratase [Porphyromonadaceae bacterium]MDD2910077.1 prephenate dehydratase [Petrimonas sp.]MDD4015430.1 prephenate dehydratase [Petrimonas sp.]